MSTYVHTCSVWGATLKMFPNLLCFSRSPQEYNEFYRVPPSIPDKSYVHTYIHSSMQNRPHVSFSLKKYYFPSTVPRGASDMTKFYLLCFKGSKIN